MARDPDVRARGRFGRFVARVMRRCARLGLAGAGMGVLLLVLGFVGVIPVRAYVDQKRQLSSTEQRVALLDAQNGELARQVGVLKTPAEIERLARRQFGMVRPGERALAIPGLRSTPGGIIGDESLPPSIGAAPEASVPPKASLLRELVQLAQFWR